VSPPSKFSAFLGNPIAVARLKRAVAAGRVPHAMIFAGPEGVGKKTLGMLLARRLNCLRPEGEDPCADCPSCRKMDAGMHPDFMLVQPDGAFIKIEQIRAVIGEVAFQPFEGQYRLIIFDRADQMRAEAANSLLKTLEEPSSRTILILVTSQPYSLLPTIRSRAQLIQFNAIPQEQIFEYLVRQTGLQLPEARLAAALSNGSLAAAAGFDIDGYREVRSQALRFLTLMLCRASFAETSRLAAALAKDKESFLIWLDAVDAVLQDLFYAHVAPHRMSQTDLAAELEQLSRMVPAAGVTSAIRAFRHLRRALHFNVNRQIALESLYIRYCRDEPPDYEAR